ncbi:MAG: PA0069 family radical SAM protein [Gammaproteobacteria bacterium]|nr:PA0069 family radical SAM protein [Gammaproteobacteria bacterium]
MTGSTRKVRGRGTTESPDGRYLEYKRQAFEDDWGRGEEISAVNTSYSMESARSIISKNNSPDIPFELSINPYRGCEHGCNYCYARPSHAYLDLSPGLDFETRIFVKHNAVELLEQEIAASSYICKPIAMGTNTDPYQPIERKQRITRGILEMLLEHKHPLTIVTKSHLVLRDIDILSSLAEKELVQVFVSVTSLDPQLTSSLEPRASAPFRRLQTIEKLSSAGIPVGLMFAPVIPMINDAEMEKIIEFCAEAGAETAGYVMLRLPHEVKELFRVWLSEHFPLRKDRVMSIVNDMHGGKDYDSKYYDRMRGQGVFASLLRKRFIHSCKLYGLNRKRKTLNNTLFEKPVLSGSQQQLF